MRALAPLLLGSLLATSALAETRSLTLDATLTDGGPAVPSGVVWRIFRDAAADETEAGGGLTMTATAEGGTATFDLAPGAYYIHAGYGRSGVTARVDVAERDEKRTLVLSAGGLKLQALSGERPIRPDRLHFNVYEHKPGKDGRRKLVAINVEPDRLVRLNAGTYHVLSKYGRVNATVRADLVVREGEVTTATLQHRGAPVSFRLVSEIGGSPIASTAWTVFTAQGRKVWSSRSASPGTVLAEGDYEAVAVNGNRRLRHEFKVVAGDTLMIEVLLP